MSSSARSSNEFAAAASNDSDQTSTVIPSRPCVIQNFRPAAGLSGRIYRCASTDGLADVDDANNLHKAERKILHETGLILDLRSPSERDDGRAMKWSSKASFEVRDGADSGSNAAAAEKQVLRIDVLSPSRFFAYADRHFLSPTQRVLSKLYMIAQADKAHELRIEALNERGLSGLNEVILETGGNELCLALKEITLQLERDNGLDAGVHCVQGKDRTGMLVMLCQSIVGLSDDGIIEDYHKSNEMAFGSAAADDIAKPRKRGKLDRNAFSGAPKQAMVNTLAMLRERYASIDGYLDFIGFGSSWRDRFRRSLLVGHIDQSRL